MSFKEAVGRYFAITEVYTKKWLVPSYNSARTGTVVYPRNTSVSNGMAAVRIFHAEPGITSPFSFPIVLKRPNDSPRRILFRQNRFSPLIHGDVIKLMPAGSSLLEVGPNCKLPVKKILLSFGGFYYM